jgi:hypothetical protein
MEDNQVEPEDGDDQRDERDELMIVCLSEGWTHQRVADQVGVSTKTIQRRMGEPSFAAAVAKRRRERVEQLTGQLITASDGAVGVLRDLLASDDPKVQLRAATLTLGNANRFHQGEQDRELARRQDEMDQRLQEAIDAMAGITGGTYEGGQQ